MEKFKNILILCLFVITTSLSFYVYFLKQSINESKAKNIELLEDNKKRQKEVEAMVSKVDSIRADFKHKQDLIKQSYEKQKESIKDSLRNKISRIDSLSDDEHIQLLSEYLSKKDSN